MNAFSASFPLNFVAFPSFEKNVESVDRQFAIAFEIAIIVSILNIL